MTPDEVRRLLNEEWERIDREAEQKKDSQSAVFALEVSVAVSRRRGRSANDEVIEWLLSGDPKRQYDALALMQDFSIVTALPALRALADRFEQADTPSAPYDWAAVNRVIGDPVSLDR